VTRLATNKTRQLAAWILTACLVWAAIALPGQAQGQPPITAGVDRTTLAVGETLRLTVTVSIDSLNPPQPELPPLAGFNIVGTSTSSQFSFINGQMTTTVSTIYQLQAIEAGEWTIDAISLTHGGNTYTTQPIQITVTEGALPQTTAQTPADASAPSELNGQDFFIEAEVDNPTPYTGQAVTYTFRFYQAVNLFDQPYYDPPTFTGFWSEAQADQGQYNANAAGRLYRVTELYTVLFPTGPGPVTIEPARLTIPGSFFENDARLETRPIELQVQALPEGAPADFAGAVGQYDLSAEVDITSGQVNQPFTLRVTLAGSGNLNSLPDPQWPDTPNWRVFDSQATTNTESKSGQISGSRVYERLMVPEKAGDDTIPPIQYSFFDPQAEEYRTVSTEAIPVTVAPAEDTEAPAVVAVPGKEEVALLATDIRHLKPVPPVLRQTEAPLTKSWLYWLGWALPVAALAAGVAWQWRVRRRQQDPAWVRSSQAAARARRSVQQAQQAGDDAYVAAARILDSYLSDKLGKPAAGLTHRALASTLGERGVEPALVEQVVDCRRQSEMGRYAPGAEAQTGASLLQQVDALVSELEGQLS